MTSLEWSALDNALINCPPDAGFFSARRELLLLFDQLLAVPCSENDPAVAGYYNLRAARAIAEINAYSGEAPRMWKFYSSGVVIKAGGKCIGFDLNRGCEMENLHRRVRLKLSDENFAALAQQLDMLCVTHAHIDHVNGDFADLLAQRNIPIVTNSDVIDRFLLRTGVDGNVETVPGLHCFSSFQRGASRENDMPNMSFLLSVGGVNIFYKGDLYWGRDLEAVFKQIDDLNLGADYFISSPWTAQEPDIVELCRLRKHCFIPVHEWEFSHRKYGTSGVATQSFGALYDIFADDIRRGYAALLSWGESITL